MAPEAGTPVTHEPFTPKEYGKIRELGGSALSEILEWPLLNQAEAFRTIAEHEFALHGDAGFIRKNLDAARERVTGVLDDDRGVHFVDQQVDAYCELAATAHRTGQPAEYVGNILESALQTALNADPESIRSWHGTTGMLETIVETARENEQDTAFLQPAVDHEYETAQAQEDVRERAVGIAEAFGHATEWGLDDKFREALIDRARRDAHDADTAGDRIAGLIVAAALRSEFDDGQPDNARVIIGEARQELIGLTNLSERVDYLAALAEVSHNTEQPPEYTGEFLKGMVREVFTQVGDEAVLDDMDAAVERMPEEMQDELRRAIEPVDVSNVIRTIAESPSDLMSATRRHMLLNRALRLLGDPEEIPESFLKANGIVRRPFNFAFAA